MSTNCTTNIGCKQCQYDVCKSNGKNCKNPEQQPGLPSHGLSRHQTQSIDSRCNLENYKTNFFGGRKSKKYKKSKKLRKSRRRK